MISSLSGGGAEGVCVSIANSFAENANTISYELLTAISQRVKRIIMK